MKLGYVGLGKMGLNMALHLVEQGVEVVGANRTSEAIEELKEAGGLGSESIEDMMGQLDSPAVVWLMVPHSAVDDVIKELTPHLEKGDVVIDGGNSPYKESIRRAKELNDKGVKFLDCGVSGGPDGAREGACLMIGGDEEVFNDHKKLFKQIAAPEAYGYFGPAGSGHFVKMVHNGIEYGMMQAIAEGFHVMQCTEEFDLDLKEIARVYNQESVITSRLIGWLHNAFDEHGNDLKDVPGSAGSLGEGAWTVDTAHELGLPDKVIHEALRARERSHDMPNYQGQIIQALRNQFGKHPLEKSDMIS